MKCAYVLRTVGNCIIAGQPTWAALEAYHFSFIAGRTLLAFLGIHFVQVKDTHCVLDVFPEGASKQEQSRFTKHNTSISHPTRLIFRKKSALIEQRAIWAILVRALRVTRFSAIIKSDLEKICELGSGFGSSRNDLLYRNSSWIFTEDFWRPSRDIRINDDIGSYDDLDDFFSKQRDSNFAFAAIFARVLSSLVSEMQEQSGVDILRTSYAPCLRRFSGFSLQNLESLYSTIYKKDGYSLVIDEMSP
jgi:hypothetical protein